MATLLLRLAAPMQAWGMDSKFDTRQTSREPTKSAAIGLLASALGIMREDKAALERLNALQFGVRCDQEGRLLRDFHTAKSYKSLDGYIKADPDNMKSAYVTNRYYLSDAVFLAGFSSENTEYLQALANALSSPAFPLFLGRRSCPPTLPLVLGIRSLPLKEALSQEPWQASNFCQKQWKRKSLNAQQVVLRCLADADGSESALGVQRDVPVSFDIRQREHTFRKVMQWYAKIPFNDVMAENFSTEHDAMAEVISCT